MRPGKDFLERVAAAAIDSGLADAVLDRKSVV